MPLSLDEFVRELDVRSARELVSAEVFERPSFLFGSEPHLEAELKRYLSDELHVAEANVFIVGSAKMGYSLSPDTFGRAFGDSSDVDIVVVDQNIFDQIWGYLLDWRYPWHVRKWSDRDLTWGVARMEEFICGRCSPDRIKYKGLGFGSLLTPMRDISAHWFNTFQGVGAAIPALASRTYEGRLYRTIDHALRYHTSGLKEASKRYKNSIRALP